MYAVGYVNVHPRYMTCQKNWEKKLFIHAKYGGVIRFSAGSREQLAYVSIHRLRSALTARDNERTDILPR